MRIREPGWKNFESGIRNGKNLDPGWEKFGSRINMSDPQHCMKWTLSLLVPISFTDMVPFGIAPIPTV
jgi:hypothetical protein